MQAATGLLVVMPMLVAVPTSNFLSCLGQGKSTLQDSLPGWMLAYSERVCTCCLQPVMLVFLVTSDCARDAFGVCADGRDGGMVLGLDALEGPAGLLLDLAAPCLWLLK